ncbi:MAG: ATP-binding protein [Burkholderiales bacterium]|nr:ATP-binding protein [Burkholderiales bacterium]HQY07936.1 ATP-binding protein [Burkholderiaceae bacterium]
MIDDDILCAEEFSERADTPLDEAYQPLIRRWMLRALLRCNGVSRFLRECRFSDHHLAKYFGLTEAQMERGKEGSIQKLLAKQLQALEAQPSVLPATRLSGNLARVAEHLQFSPVELDILHLTVLQRLDKALEEVLDMIGSLTRSSAVRLFAECLGHPQREVQRALDDRSRLCRSALLTIDDRRPYEFSNKVDLLDGFAEALMLEHQELLDLFAANLVPSPAPQLQRADFAHLERDFTILAQYLDVVCRMGQRGVNVLIHGRPGTGKTELVRCLAQEVGAKLLEIPCELPGGEPRAGKERFESYRFAQGLLEGGARQLLLFDEVEDVFNESMRGRRGGNASGIKGWVNHLLERNPVPTFWVTNDLRPIDAAYLRRFDYVLKLDVPPARVRRRVLERHLGALELPEAWRNAAASHEGLVPAVVERAARVCLTVCDASPDLQPQAVMTQVMNNTLLALGTAALPCAQRDPVGEYRLDWLHADCDLQRLRDGLLSVGAGRLCFWGPPGTGKTEFGRYLARELDRPLLVKRVSDILSPYVGEAERHIAEMFAQARVDGAVLLLDEADSFLRSRRGAQRSWEVTQVNEMLTQMEDFDGLFIASTNLMDQLDEAAMRRFDACIRLDFLRPAQAQAMFAETAGKLGLQVDSATRQALTGMDRLAPGDFAAVLRGARLHPPAGAADLLARLRQLAALKSKSAERPMGFLAALE